MIQHLFVPAVIGATYAGEECSRCSELAYNHGQAEPLATCTYCGAYSTFKHTSVGALWFLPCSCGMWGPGRTTQDVFRGMVLDEVARRQTQAILTGLPIVRMRLERGL